MIHLQQRSWGSDRKRRHQAVLRVTQGGCIPNLVKIGPWEMPGRPDGRTACIRLYARPPVLFHNTTGRAKNWCAHRTGSTSMKAREEKVSRVFW
jgi:hypothetical protein